MKRKSLATILVLVMSIAILISGCGSSANTASSTESNTATETTQSKETSDTAAKASFKAAADITAPAGKTLASLPIDKASEKPLKIATVMVQNNPFGAAVLKGQQFAKEVLADRNATVDCISVDDFDPMKWTNTLDNLITSGYDAITFFGVSKELVPVTKKAVDAGILVYCFNCDTGKESGRTAWYGMDDKAAGVAAGEALVKAVGKDGKYAIITGSFNVTGHELRRKGARSITDNEKGLKLVGEYENNDAADKAYTLATNIINANPDIKAIYVTAGGPSGAAQAIQDAGMTGKIALLCHDVLQETAPYIKSGTISVCIDQDPFNQGYQPVVDAYNQLVDKKVPQELNYYKPVIATPENVANLFPELFK